MPADGKKLYTFLIRKQGATKDEVKTVAAMDVYEATIALSVWAPGVHIIEMLGVFAEGSKIGGVS